MTQTDAQLGHEIHDVVIQKLSPKDGTLDLLRYDDHLLHRIGVIQFKQLEPGEHIELPLRPEADELWYLLNGDCTFQLQDKREDSPSAEVSLRYKASDPTMLLAPFGVAFSLGTEGGCQLLRAATHEPEEI